MCLLSPVILLLCKFSISLSRTGSGEAMGQARWFATLIKTAQAQSRQVTSDGKFHESLRVYPWLLVVSQMSARAGCS